MHTYIYKRAEVGDIGHNSGQFHAFDEVIGRLHTRVELERFSLSARVATRFFQFGHDVAQGRQAHRWRYITLDINLATLVSAGNQLRNRATTIGCHLLHNSVTFGVYGRGVERIFSFGHAQEASTLLECRRPQTWNLF